MTMQTTHMSRHGQRTSGAVILAAALVSALPVFWLGLTSIASAWGRPEYSHGPLIPLISLFLFLRGLRDAKPVAHRVTRWPGLIVVACALVVACLGNIAGLPDLVSYALILWLAGVVWICMGWQEASRHQLAVFHLIFMLPLPQFFYWKLTIFLQGVSSELGVWLIRLADIPVFLDGNVIDLGPYKLLVAEACSGLRYLFPILSFSYLMALLFRGPGWHKMVLFGMAAPLCVGMNAVRIGVIGVLVDVRGISAAEGFLHLFEGWVIFAACLVILGLTACLLQRFGRRPLAPADMVDLDMTGVGQQAGRVVGLRPSSALKAAAILGLITSVALLLTPRAEQDPPARAGFALFPNALGAWSGINHDLDPAIAQVLGATDYINSTYRTDHAGAEVQFFAAWYASQTKGQGIHSPEVCLPGAGWEIAALAPHEVDMPNTVYGRFTVNRAVIQKGLDRQLVYYWFEQRGRRMTQDFSVKMSVLRDGLTMGRTDGALVRFLTPIDPAEAVPEADVRLQAFMREALGQLPLYVP